jgi:glycosyltransferase involved in cell wall biosynthesis
MKLIYVAGRWDPTIQNEYSGSDYGAYHMLKKQPDIDIVMVGPLEDNPTHIEKLIYRGYNAISKKRLIKYCPSYLKEIGKKVNQAVKDHQPDVIFSKYSSPMVHVDISKPFVYMCDSTIQWTKKYWPEFSNLGFNIMEKWEAKSIDKCDRIITFSEANANVIKSHYHKNPEKVRVMPIPAYIPPEHLPAKKFITKEMGQPLHILLVGKRFDLRGMDIAVDTVNILNHAGIPTQLRIVGLDGEDQENVQFMGAYEKEDPQQMKTYFEFFSWADLLIHPSRFHSAGIVISEAAAFGLPTITNAAGGLATTVQHDQTGIVLPEDSPPQAYADAIMDLLNDKTRYQRYRVNARDRFDDILNWEKAGIRLAQIIKEVLL